MNTVHLWVADCLRLEIKALHEESSGLDLNPTVQMIEFKVVEDEVKKE